MISSREASPELVKGRIITQEPPFVSTYKSRKPRFFFRKTGKPADFSGRGWMPQKHQNRTSRARGHRPIAVPSVNEVGP